MIYQVRSFEEEEDDECLSLKRLRIISTLTRATDTITNSCSPDQKLTRSKLYSWMLRSRSSICENARCISFDFRKLFPTWSVEPCNTLANSVVNVTFYAHLQSVRDYSMITHEINLQLTTKIIFTTHFSKRLDHKMRRLLNLNKYIIHFIQNNTQ